MTWIDAFWHLLGFFAPAFGVGAFSAGLAKGLWRRELQAMRWRVLAAWSTAAAALALVGGLVVFGRDGRIATYAGVVTGCALALWWKGFVQRR